MTPQRKRSLAAALGLAVTVRIALVAAAWVAGGDAARFLTSDSTAYLRIARTLAETGAFRDAGLPDLTHLPGFPALVAVGVRVGHPIAFTLAVNIVFGVLTAWLCYLAAVEVGGERAGSRAAWLFAIEPGQIAWGAFVMTESLYTVLAAISLVLGLRYVKRPGTAVLVGSVVAAVLGAYVRVVGYLLPVVWLLLLVWIAGREGCRQWRRHILAGASIILVLLGAWHLRNGLASGYWGFTTQADRALYITGGAAVVASVQGSNVTDARAAMLDAMGEERNRTSTPETAAAMRQRGGELVARHPIVFLRTYGAGMVGAMLQPGVAPFLWLFGRMQAETPDSAMRLILINRWGDAWGLLADRGALYWTLAASLFALNLLYLWWAARGALIGWRGGLRVAVTLLAVTILYFLALSGGPDATSRRRVPFTPAICVLASLGWRRDPPLY
jgi:4-amino-4-deoxy-L-arabinose transferase-like glycosyltransferase